MSEQEEQAQAGQEINAEIWSVAQNMVDDLQRQLREAQELLRGLVFAIDEPNVYDHGCAACGRYIGEHKPDCPWLLAKQYLETTQPQTPQSD